MTQEHPITPPEWLIEERSNDWKYSFTDDAKFFARWGADQELKASRELLEINGCPSKWIDMLRAARRPKPPSLKELNLKHLDVMERDGYYLPEIIADLRRAIKSLPS